MAVADLQQSQYRFDRGLVRHAPRSLQSQRRSGLGGRCGCMKRSSGDGMKR
jgi:hypothetical protein